MMKKNEMETKKLYSLDETKKLSNEFFLSNPEYKLAYSVDVVEPEEFLESLSERFKVVPPIIFKASINSQDDVLTFAFKDKFELSLFLSLGGYDEENEVLHRFWNEIESEGYINTFLAED